MSMAPSFAEKANPYAVSAILDASANGGIVASEDIVDENGVKLWARNQPVSHALQQRLLERKLRQPLESCLRAPDGVNVAELLACAQSVLGTDASFAIAIEPWGNEALDEVRQLQLHPAVQLLLTAAQAAKPDNLEHAVRSMLLAGAMSISTTGGHGQNRLALLGGLLHDLGELYVNPVYLDAAFSLTPQTYRHRVIHPRTGELLIAKLTDYPPSLYRAVGEHHERSDGTGYPTCAGSQTLSPEGCRLSAVEAIMGIAASPRHCLWTHISLALRLIPGEFDAATLSFASQVARRANESFEPTTSFDSRAVVHGNERVNQRIHTGLKRAWNLVNQSSSPLVCRVAARAAQMLKQLALASNSLGMWAPGDLIGDDLFELSFANQELSYRLAAMRRTVSWAEPSIQPSDDDELAALWACLDDLPAHPRSALDATEAAADCTQS